MKFMHGLLIVLSITFLVAKEPTLPCVDMHAFISGTLEEQQQAALIFGKALQEIGFVAVLNAGIHEDTVGRAYDAAQRFFALPDEKKLQLHAVDGFRGFVPFGTEHAKYTDVIDLKEFFHTTGPTQPEHLWPEDVHFKISVLKLYQELETCMKICLQATAIYLGYTKQHEKTILSDLLGTGRSVMRILHYPPVDSHTIPVGALRSAPHEDLGIMTIIPRATQAGLQIQTRDGYWLDIVVPENAAIVNAGDVLSILTNGIIPSTTHRVINPPEGDLTDRYSVPFFGDILLDTVLRPLDKCGTSESTEESYMTFGEFFVKRMQDIGFKEMKER
jgi:isopenicillin N synthase-like dioxygenase